MQASTELTPITSVHAPKARTAEQAACQVTAARSTARRLTMSGDDTGWKSEQKQRGGGGSRHERERIGCPEIMH